MYIKTDDPVADYERYDAELEQERELLPECSGCGEKIEDDFCYEINDEIICEECLERNFRKHTVDVMAALTPMFPCGI